MCVCRVLCILDMHSRNKWFYDTYYPIWEQAFHSMSDGHINAFTIHVRHDDQRFVGKQRNAIYAMVRRPHTTTHTRCNRKMLFVYSIEYGAIHPIAVCRTIPYWLIQLNTILQISERIMHKLRCCTIAQFARWDNSSVRNPAFHFASEVTAWSLYQLIWFSRHRPTFW